MGGESNSHTLTKLVPPPSLSPQAATGTSHRPAVTAWGAPVRRGQGGVSAGPAERQKWLLPPEAKV